MEEDVAFGIRMKHVIELVRFEERMIHILYRRVGLDQIWNVLILRRS